MMSATSPAVAEETATRLRERLADQRIDHPDGMVSFSASIGVAVADPWSEPTIQDVLQRADHAMYEAKTAGRNRVVMATQSPRSDVDAAGTPSGLAVSW